MKMADSRLNEWEARQISNMAFRVEKIGEVYEAAMYDRPKFQSTDSPISSGIGETAHEAKIAAFIAWSRRS